LNLRKEFNIINEIIILNMTSTTSISDLPISATGDGNIQIQMQEKNVIIENKSDNLEQQREADLKTIQTQSPSAPNVPSIQNQVKTSDLNKFVTGVQDAAAAGVLNLPARDIPQSQNHITQDAQIQPNFVPPSHQGDYIGQGQTNEEIIRRNAAKTQQKDSLDQMYDNLQTPLLLAVIYFIFQLPIVHKNMLRMLPGLFKQDGHPTLSGYVLTSISFASMYVTLTQVMEYFSL